jgi:hypothetical protein
MSMDTLSLDADFSLLQEQLPDLSEEPFLNFGEFGSDDMNVELPGSQSGSQQEQAATPAPAPPASSPPPVRISVFRFFQIPWWNGPAVTPTGFDMY